MFKNLVSLCLFLAIAILFSTTATAQPTDARQRVDMNSADAFNELDGLKTVPCFPNCSLRDKSETAWNELVCRIEKNVCEVFKELNLAEEQRPRIQVRNDCIFLQRTDDFTGILDLPVNTSPSIPLVICQNKNGLVDGTGDDSKGIFWGQKTALKQYKDFLELNPEASTQNSDIRHAIGTFLLVYEMYLRNGDTKDPIWWDSIEPEDQEWLARARPAILYRWQNRLKLHQ